MDNLESLEIKIEKLHLPIRVQKVADAGKFLSSCHSADLLRGYRVAHLLLDLGPDEQTLIAGLFFASRISVSDYGQKIELQFGTDVLKILEGLTRLAYIKPDFERNDMEVLRQVILMMAEDFRVMLICLADKLHDVTNIETFSVAEQKQLAEESLKIYAPVASRLGMYSIKWRLEDLAFKALNPFQYNNIQLQLERIGKERKDALEEFQKELRDYLEQHHVECRISGRTKSIYSIYRKMRRKSTDLILDLHDIFAVRIIIPTKYIDESRESTESLYSILGLIHNRWTPLPGRFKDYIAVPKPNGYQSLHTSIFTTASGLKNHPVEIQIRSERMHREAEYGIAAHWLYEDTRGKSTQFDREHILQYLDKDPECDMQNKKLQRQIEWLKGLVHVGDDDPSSHSSLEKDLHEYKLDIFHDRIFVFTPTGEVRDLPSGATPVDFAYGIHTDLGHRCAMAKVNGNIVPLNMQLKNGDVLEIVLKPKPNPRPEWLSFVKTSGARQKIKVWFKSQNRDLSFREGKELLNKQLRRLNKSGLDDQLSLLKEYGGKQLSVAERQKVIEDIGSGSASVTSVVRKIFHQEDLMQPLIPTPLKEIPSSAPLDAKILLGGEAGLPVRLAQCCLPKEGERIVGYVTRQHASIHRLDCSHLQNSNPARVLEAKWVTSLREKQKYSVRIIVEAVNRIGLIRDLTSVIADMGVNILDFSVKHQDEKFVTRSLQLEVNGYEQLDEILGKLEAVTGVVHVTREASREHQGILAKKKSAPSKVPGESD